ncbi:hypothetical protein DIPPA_15057 [Diplonema papillatum]|nr:hypothetical protein DIPPA_15057 [Diplonema papillatum]
MDDLVRKLVSPGIGVREHEDALKALIVVTRHGPVTEGHVALTQEIFARNLVFGRKSATPAAQLASTEAITLLTLELVTTQLRSYEAHGGALRDHQVSAGITALVLKTTLDLLATEKSNDIRVAALACAECFWAVVDEETMVGFFPGTVSSLCKLLLGSSDRRMAQRVCQGALAALATALEKACGDAANDAAIKELDAQSEPRASIQRMTEQGTSPADLLKQVVHSGRRPAEDGGECTAAVHRKESESLRRVSRDAEWLKLTRGKLGDALSGLLGAVASCSGKGHVYGEAHPRLAAFAAFAGGVLRTCSRALPGLVPPLLQVCFLQTFSGSAAAPNKLPDGVAEAARQYAARSGGLALRAQLETLALHMPQHPHYAYTIAGWVAHVFRRDTCRELSLVADAFLTDTVRAMVRAVASVGSPDFRSFAKQHGSVLGAVSALGGALAAWHPLRDVIDILLADLRDFKRWRQHHAVTWTLKVVVSRAGHNAFVGGADELCELVALPVSAFTAIPEMWYFKDTPGTPVASLTHCVALCRLMLECIATAAIALFGYNNGEARGKRTRDRFLLQVVYPVVEKTASKHTDLSETAADVLKVVAGESMQGATSESGGRLVARLILTSFDWIIDAVASRLPFGDDYADAPAALSSSLSLLNPLLSRCGADDDLLMLLQHVQHNVSETILVRHSPTSVLSMTARVAALLSRSVRLKQATLFEGGLHASGSATTAVTVAACVLELARRAANGEEIKTEEDSENPSGHHEEAPCSEEGLWCKRERHLAFEILQQLRHHLTSTRVEHGLACEAVKSCVLVFCSFDGVSDKLQDGRRTDAPIPVICNGEVVDLVTSWAKDFTRSSAENAKRGATATAADPEAEPLAEPFTGRPVFKGGIASKVLNNLHLLWSPLVARLLPPGFSGVKELRQRLTPSHVAHYSSIAVRKRLLKYNLPVLDIGACVLHVVDIALFLLVYARDFMEDRVRKELLPLLEYHLVLSPHLFYEFPGAQPGYVENTVLYRFQFACLLLLLAAFPTSLREEFQKARAKPDEYRFSSETPSALEPMFAGIIATTQRFLHPQQPSALREAARTLHSHLKWLMSDGDAEGGASLVDRASAPDGGKAAPAASNGRAAGEGLVAAEEGLNSGQEDALVPPEEGPSDEQPASGASNGHAAEEGVAAVEKGLIGEHDERLVPPEGEPSDKRPVPAALNGHAAEEGVAAVEKGLVGEHEETLVTP